MSDWFGLAFFVLFFIGIYVGLKLLSKPRKITEAEFEKRVSESTSLLGASLSALQGILDPSEAKAKEVRMQMKEGRYLKKKREGKANDDDENERQSDLEN
jgi:hypothetical protein